MPGLPAGATSLPARPAALATSALSGAVDGCPHAAGPAGLPAPHPASRVAACRAAGSPRFPAPGARR
jgi:hypothetical protein